MILRANGSIAPDSSGIKRTEAAFRNVAGEPTREDAGGWGDLVRHVHSQVTGNLWEHLGILWSKNEGEKKEKVKPWSMSCLLKR